MSRRGSLARRLFGTVIILLAVGLIAGGAAAYWYLGPYGGSGTDTFVEIEHGMSSHAIAQELARDRVVRSPEAFLAVRILHFGATLQAGEYKFAGAETPWQVFNKIRRGEIFYEEFTVPEGSNMFDISALLKGGDTVTPEAFLKAANDATSIRDLDPNAPNLEGYLFPSTYRVTRKITGRQLCRLMTTEFRKQWAIFGGAEAQGGTHRIVTIASLVEKESANPGERPLIAGLFTNRLNLGMPLQCDPTTVYAALLENRYRGTIHRSDLASANPYNTYTHTGLPPGPICNPGAQSLKAALQPASTDALYFVAKPDGSGSHQFSATLEQHEKAVLAYRKGLHP